MTLTYQQALLRATALCAASEQCEHHIREKLAKWNLPSSDADKIIDYLYDEKYLDELRFANAYARDKMRYNHWGRIKIDQAMRLLHIGTSARHEALLSLPQQEYLDILQELLASKLRTIKADTTFQRNAKLIRFALGRGFEMNNIMRFVGEEE